MAAATRLEAEASHFTDVIEKISERLLCHVARMDADVNQRFRNIEDYLRGVVTIKAHDANVKDQRVLNLKQKTELLHLQLGSVYRKINLSLIEKCTRVHDGRTNGSH